MVVLGIERPFCWYLVTSSELIRFSRNSATIYVQMVLARSTWSDSQSFDNLSQNPKSNFLDQAYIHTSSGLSMEGLRRTGRKLLLWPQIARLWWRWRNRSSGSQLPGIVFAHCSYVNNCYTYHHFRLTWFIQYGAMVLRTCLEHQDPIKHQGWIAHGLMSLPSNLSACDTDPHDSPHPLAMWQPSVEQRIGCIV